MPAEDIRIDWNNDGDWSDTGEDVTTRVLSEISMRLGRDQVRSLSPTSPGEAGFALDNESRDYSPENTSSPLAGNVRPGRPVRVQKTHSAVTYDLFRGYIDGLELDPAKVGLSTAGVTCVDALSRFQDVVISTELYSGISTGRAIGLVLDAAGWPASARDLDIGATWIPFWWEENVSAWDAIVRLVNSEGPPAFITADGSGTIVFRDRHHRLTRTASNTVQATFRDTGAEPNFSAPLGYEAGWRDIINAVSIQVDTREPLETNTEIWTYGPDFVLRGGETVVIKAEFSNPCKDIVGPGYEIVHNGGTNLTDVQVTMSRTSGQSVVITFYGVGPSTASDLITGPTGSQVVGTGIRLVGREVAVVSTNTVEAVDADSVSQHGHKSHTIDAPWVNLNDAAAITELVIGQRAERLPIVSPTLTSGVGGDTTRMTQMLERDLSDRVHLVDAETGLDADCFIEQIRHTSTQAGMKHDTVFGLEKARDQPAAVFVLDVSQLDVGTLGYRGVQTGDYFKLGTSLLGTGKLAY